LPFLSRKNKFCRAEALGKAQKTRVFYKNPYGKNLPTRTGLPARFRENAAAVPATSVAGSGSGGFNRSPRIGLKTYPCNMHQYC